MKNSENTLMKITEEDYKKDAHSTWASFFVINVFVGFGSDNSQGCYSLPQGEGYLFVASATP